MISKRIYGTILILMLMVFIMFMFAGVSSNILSDISTNSQALEKVDIDYEDTLTADSLNIEEDISGSGGKGRDVLNPERKLHAAILSGGTEDTIAKLLIEWCVYHKYLYRIYTSLPKEEEIADYDVILFGEYKLTEEDCGLLYAYADIGITMIFTKLPAYKELQSHRDLADFYGINAEINDSVTADGIKIFGNFMISRERNYQKGDFYGEEDDTAISVPYYSLAAGYEVYAVGILENQDELDIKDEELPPLLWRTKTKNSFVFIVNSDIFDGMSILGVLTGFMAKESECYVYPIVNAQTISLLDYPYFSDENSATTKQLYSRTSEAVARDLLWPNIIQILKNYGESYSFFAAPQLDYLDDIGPKKDYLDFYLREIGKLPGVMSLSLDQISGADLKNIISQDEKFFKEYLPDYHFTALYSADYTADEVKNCLDNEFLEDISLVMSDYQEGDDLISFLQDDVLSVKFNLDGYQHETMDNLQMSCIENAIGMCNMKVDIGRAIYPKDSTDEWNHLSLRWSKGDTYFDDYSKFDTVSIYELEKRIRRFLALDFTYKYDNSDVDITIDHFDEEAYFILRIYSKSIASVENGIAEKISEDTYLIKAMDADVHIHLTEENVLKKPDNNKIIPSNPK